MVWIRLGFGDGNDWGAFNGVGEWGIEGISRKKGAKVCVFTNVVGFVGAMSYHFACLVLFYKYCGRLRHLSSSPKSLRVNQS
jgi:hypothetical protein